MENCSQIFKQYLKLTERVRKIDPEGREAGSYKLMAIGTEYTHTRNILIVIPYCYLGNYYDLGRKTKQD